MSEQTSNNEPLELRLQTREDIFKAIFSSDFRVRIATLAAIQQSPAKALGFGDWPSGDIVDLLIGIIREEKSFLIFHAALAALFSFDDPRALEEAKNVFSSASNVEALQIAAHYIGQKFENEGRVFLGQFLQNLDVMTRSRLAAQQLASRGDLSREEQLWVALLASETGAIPPELSESSYALWQGAWLSPLATQAHGLIENMGEPAFQFLCGKWPDLDSGTRIWLLDWSARSFLLKAEKLLLLALSDPYDEVRFEALTIVACSRIDRTPFSEALTKLNVPDGTQNWEPFLIEAGIPISDVRSRIATETDQHTRVALVRRLVGDHSAIAYLGELLADQDWQVRATATDVLAGMGEIVTPWARQWQSQSNVQVQVAATRILEQIKNTSQEKICKVCD